MIGGGEVRVRARVLVRDRSGGCGRIYVACRREGGWSTLSVGRGTAKRETLAWWAMGDWWCHHVILTPKRRGTSGPGYDIVMIARSAREPVQIELLALCKYTYNNLQAHLSFFSSALLSRL